MKMPCQEALSAILYHHVCSCIFPIFSLLFSNTSEGCAGAVKRVLGKIDGVKSIDTNVEAKTVIVEAEESVAPEFMLEKLQKVSVE